MAKLDEPVNRSGWKAAGVPGRQILLLFLLLAIMLPPTEALSQAGGTLRIRVTGLRSTTGQALVLVYATAAGFPGSKEKALVSRYEPLSGTTAEFTVAGLAPGTYAVVIVHDENANREIDSNFLGIPKEGVGVSNGPQKRWGPPLFKPASFLLPPQGLTIDIPLRYL